MEWIKIYKKIKYMKINRILLFMLIVTLIACQKQVDYTPQLNDLNSNIRALQKSRDSLATALSQSNLNILTLQKNNDSLSKSIKSTDSLLNKLNISNSAIFKSLDSIKLQLSTMNVQILSLTIQMNSANADILSINNQISILNLQYNNLSKLFNNLILQTSISNGLVAYFPLNGNANDSSSNGNNGVVNGASLTADRFGNPNSAYSFDGYHEISAPSKDYLNILGDMSISAWFFASGFPTFRTCYTILTKRVSISAGMPYDLCINYQYGYNNNSDYNKLMFASDSYYPNYQYLQSSTNATNNKWSNIIATISGTNLKIYLDEVLVLDTIVNNSLRVANVSSLIIGGGARPDKPSEQFIGNLDDIRLYNRTLTQSEISYLASH